jgi:hypothetical protein
LAERSSSSIQFAPEDALGILQCNTELLPIPRHRARPAVAEAVAVTRARILAKAVSRDGEASSLNGEMPRSAVVRGMLPIGSVGICIGSWPGGHCLGEREA